MQLAIISDTHMPKGAREIPEACLERARESDLILHAGDLITLSVLELLQSLGPPVVAVHGNVCDADVRAVLPERTQVDAGGVQIGMVHEPGPAKGRAARLRRAFPDCDAVVFGHTHMPELITTPDGFQAFNPGSPTERRRAPLHTMGIALVEDGAISFELLNV